MTEQNLNTESETKTPTPNSSMPGMPGMPSADSAPSGDLNPPAHEEKPPVIDTPDNTVTNNVILPVESVRKPIEVVASRAGFFTQHRKKTGDKFSVASFNKLGEWMTCVDPVLEKKRIEFFKEKKRKAKK